MAIVNPPPSQFLQQGTGAVARSPQSKMRETFSVEDFQSAGMDDGAAILAALAAVIAAGGGTVDLAARTYTMTTFADSQYAISIANTSNVRLRGRGKGQTIIKIGSGAQRGGIGISAVTNLVIEGLTVDAQYSASGGASGVSNGLHGIRVAGSTNIILRDICVQDTGSYGIGFETGAYADISVSDFHINGTQIDAFDWKNRTLGTPNESVRIYDGLIENFGKANAGTSVAMDIRCPATISNIHVYFRDATLSVAGIRTREDDLLNTGQGGKYSTITNCHVHGTGVGTGAVGFAIYSPYTAVSNCTVDNLNGTGFHVGNQSVAGIVNLGVRLANCVVTTADRGFWFQTGDRTSASNCYADNCTNEGFRIDGVPNLRLSACDALNNAYGFRQVNAPTATRLVNCGATGNTTGNYSLTSGAYIAWQCEGLTTAIDMYADDAVQARLGAIASTTAFIELRGSNGGSPLVMAQTPDGTGNKDIELLPLGTGAVRFGTFSTNADAPVTGYITIKDFAGTARKIAVIA